MLIDFVAGRSPYNVDVQKLCTAAVFGDVQLWVSTQSYTDAYYILSRTSPEPAVRKALRSTLNRFMICGVYAEDLKPALESDWQDVEDYLIFAAAKHIAADFFITRDKEILNRLPDKAKTARDFLKWFEAEKSINYDSVPF